MNNVGVLAIGAPETLPDEAWIRTIDINLFSIARSNRVFLPGLIAQGSGHVVNTASASGLLSYGFDRLPYVASKHAIVGLSEALATYLGPKGVGVTCLCPSGVITNILEGITVYGDRGRNAASPGAPDRDRGRRRNVDRRSDRDGPIPRRDRSGGARRPPGARQGHRGIHSGRH